MQHQRLNREAKVLWSRPRLTSKRRANDTEIVLESCPSSALSRSLTSKSSAKSDRRLSLPVHDEPHRGNRVIHEGVHQESPAVWGDDILLFGPRLGGAADVRREQ